MENDSCFAIEGDLGVGEFDGIAKRVGGFGNSGGRVGLISEFVAACVHAFARMVENGGVRQNDALEGVGSCSDLIDVPEIANAIDALAMACGWSEKCGGLTTIRGGADLRELKPASRGEINKSGGSLHRHAPGKGMRPRAPVSHQIAIRFRVSAVIVAGELQGYPAKRARNCEIRRVEQGSAVIDANDTLGRFHFSRRGSCPGVRRRPEGRHTGGSTAGASGVCTTHFAILFLARLAIRK